MRAAKPVVLVQAPTRDFAVQIAEDAGKMPVHNAPKNVCMNGVGDKQRQRKQLAAGAAFDRTTPGRLIDLVATGVMFLHQTSHSVFN